VAVGVVVAVAVAVAVAVGVAVAVAVGVAVAVATGVAVAVAVGVAVAVAVGVAVAVAVGVAVAVAVGVAVAVAVGVGVGVALPEQAAEWVRFRAISRVYVFAKRPASNGSAHAAVSSPIHLCHLASDDISLETPAANSGACVFSQDDVMTRR
jgi:hypothetical protein